MINSVVNLLFQKDAFETNRVFTMITKYISEVTAEGFFTFSKYRSSKVLASNTNVVFIQVLDKVSHHLLTINSSLTLNFYSTGLATKL